MLASPAGGGPWDHCICGGKKLRSFHQLRSDPGCPLQPGAVCGVEGRHPEGHPLAALRPPVSGGLCGASGDGGSDSPRASGLTNLAVAGVGHVPIALQSLCAALRRHLLPHLGWLVVHHHLHLPRLCMHDCGCVLGGRSGKEVESGVAPIEEGKEEEAQAVVPPYAAH